MFLSDLSIKKPVMISMILVALLLFGVMAYRSLPLNLQPETDMPYVSIQTVFVGASPDQIESLITKKIEDQISAISGIDTITSYSLDSVSLITIAFNLDKDADIASQEVKEKVDGILTKLPTDADAPIVSKMDITSKAVMTLVLEGDIKPAELLNLAENSVKDALAKIPGVGSVGIDGGEKEEIKVIFDNKTIYEYNLNMSQIGGILSSNNLNLPGGSFKNEEQQYSVNFKGSIEDIETLSNSMIPTIYGNFRLDQLADVELSSVDVTKRVIYFNKDSVLHPENSVLLSVIKSHDGNPVDIANEIRVDLAEINKNLPSSVTLSIVNDDSVEIKDTVKDTLMNIVLGIVFTALILLFFLHDVRSTLIVALSMPLSIIPTFIILQKLNITLNLMSLMGISTSVGVLVMNSVVVLENIFRHKNMGHDKITASSVGTSEVTMAVFASTLTNICVFLPLGTMGGIIGLFMKDFALTVVVATIMSLFISFTLTPMMASKLLPDHSKKKLAVSVKIEAMFKSLESGYKNLLEKVLHSRGRSLALIVVTVVVFFISMAGFSKIPFEFQPVADAGKMTVEVELPLDSSLDQTALKVAEIEDVIKGFDHVKQLTTTLGAISSLDSGSNLAKIDVTLVHSSQRDITTQEEVVVVQKALGDITNAIIKVKVSSGGLDSSVVGFYLQTANVESFDSYLPIYLEKMKEITGVQYISSSSKSGKPIINIYPDHKKLSEFNINEQTLSLSLRGAIDGLVMTQVKSTTREYDVRVMLDDSNVSSYENLGMIPVVTSNGVYPVSFFADIELEQGVSKILRINKKPTVEISLGLKPGVVQSEVTSQVERVFKEVNIEEVSLKWSSAADLMKESVVNMGIAFILAVLLTYMLLAAVLGKLGQPLLILSTVPLSLIGVVIIFLMTGLAMNIISMLAIIMLVGMVVNNAILILEYTNQLRDSGKTVKDALLIACPTKLQPILMANIATILGMLPMALGLGDTGVEMRQPMGLVSTGGLIMATFLSLFVIPALENLIESKKENKKMKNSEVVC